MSGQKGKRLFCGGLRASGTRALELKLTKPRPKRQMGVHGLWRRQPQLSRDTAGFNPLSRILGKRYESWPVEQRKNPEHLLRGCWDLNPPGGPNPRNQRPQTARAAVSLVSLCVFRACTCNMGNGAPSLFRSSRNRNRDMCSLPWSRERRNSDSSAVELNGQCLTGHQRTSQVPGI